MNFSRSHLNNFDAVRLGLALLVVLVHSAILTEHPAFQPFLTYLSSDFAVKGFFVISGCLVTRSYLSSQSGQEYAVKRFRRIYPAYLVAIGVAWLIGLVATTLTAAEFLRQPATYKYLAANATFLNFLQPTLPGVFEQHAVPVMNASLWTIKVEACLYCCVPGLVWLFRRLGPYTAAALAFGVALAWGELLPKLGLSPKIAAELTRQFPGALHLFALGALYAVEYKRIGPWLGWVALGALLVFLPLRHHALRPLVEPICYAAVVLGLATRLPVQVPVGRWGDLSYGTYLLHFPLVQLFIYLGVFRQSPGVGLLALVLTVLSAAFLLWHGVEKQLLRRSSHYVAAETVSQ